MPRGRKKSHKGGHRHFTSEDDLEAEAEKARKEQEWRVMKGIESDEEEETEEAKTDPKGAAKKVEKVVPTGQPGELPPSSSEEESEDDDEDDKPKGVAHLIDIENPNRVKQKTKKVSSLDTGSQSAPATKTPSANQEGFAGPGLSRREREELEKQAAKERYEKLHLAGKTDEARADLARLALIRKQREDAARKREEEKKAQDDAKTAAEQRLLDKKQKTATDAKH